MGISGDMLMGALYGLLGEEQKQAFLSAMAAAGIPGLTIVPEPSEKCGIQGLHMKVIIHGEEEDAHNSHEYGHTHVHDHGGSALYHHQHSHDDHDLLNHSHEEHNHEDHVDSHDHSHFHDHADEHSHSHHGHHTHSSMDTINHWIEDLHLDQELKNGIREVYLKIAEAESKAHGVPVTDIHFHEVGRLDALADIAGNLLLVSMLKPERIIVSPICTGYGQVHCAHGWLQIPAPATGYLLEGIPSYAGRTEGEMATPTGVALVKNIADEFAWQSMMVTEKTAFGMGTRDYPGIANALKAVLGSSMDQAEQAQEPGDEDTVCQLVCVIDDMTPESIAYACKAILYAGALEAYVAPVVMKKGRPGYELTVLGKEADQDRLIRSVFEQTTTIGIRKSFLGRSILFRNERKLQTPYGEIRFKDCFGYGVSRSKAEFDDLQAAARISGKSLMEIREAVEAIDIDPDPESDQ